MFSSNASTAVDQQTPDRPLAIYPMAFCQIYPRRPGARRVSDGSTRVDTPFMFPNGPVLNTFDARSAGTLDFNSYTDNNDNKAVGGRVVFSNPRSRGRFWLWRLPKPASRNDFFLAFKRWSIRRLEVVAIPPC